MFSVTSKNRSSYYNYLARLNLEAAKAADKDVGFWPGYEIAAPPPVMTLCAHTIELALKAYLLDKGVDEKSVQRFNHDLVKCWGKCVEMGAPSELLNIDTLKIISDLLSSNRLRYGEKSRLGSVPVFGPLKEVCDQCLELCGAPTRNEILRH